MGKRPELSSVSELIAAVGARVAAIQEILNSGISKGVHGKTNANSDWVAHMSTRPGELYRLTFFSDGEPTGHVAFSELREMSSYLAGIIKFDCIEQFAKQSHLTKCV